MAPPDPLGSSESRFAMVKLSNALNRQSDFGLAVNWAHHRKRKWVSAYAFSLVEAIIEAFDPIIISSQLDYSLNKRRIRRLISFEPGISAPAVRYDTRIDCVKSIIMSDPHYRTASRREYIDRNGFDYVFSVYRDPFFRHFKGFSQDRFVHFPWGVADCYVSTQEITVRSDEVAIFGGRRSDAYDVRNWCREQACVTEYEFSGVENKVLTDADFFSWLGRKQAIVAAGSSNPIYDLVTPKYFEIASAGALLVGQYCSDLKTLGFDDSNMLPFAKGTFLDRVAEYKGDPARYVPVRERGRELIKQRHLLSHRIDLIRSVLDA